MTVNDNIKDAVLVRAIGRRKEAVAQVQFSTGNGQFLINGKLAQDYLQQNSCSLLSVKAPFEMLSLLENSPKLEQMDTIVKVEGGGLIGQAEAIKLAVARAIAKLNDTENCEIRKNLKQKGYLTQDARSKERRKYGLKKARKASQYHKR
jgi:small subunit ribosomal protein S9